MRLTFLLLLLVNLLLFAWGQGMFGEQDAGRESARLTQQIDPEKIRILPGGAVEEAPPASKEVELQCKQIEKLATADAAELRKILADIPGWQAELKTRKGAPLYRVMIPELAGQTAAQKKLGEVRRLGIEEGTLVAEGGQEVFALLLNTLPSAKDADDYLQSLNRKGVRSARILPTEASETTVIEIHAPANDFEHKLMDLLAPLKSAVLIDCPVQ